MSIPLVFLHGFLGCKEDWDEVISHLSPHFSCVAIDLPGHGATPYTEDIAGHVREYIRSHFPQKPHCIGYSMGGRIALQIADSCASTTLLSSHPGLAHEEERALRWETDSHWIDQLLTTPFEDFLQNWYAQPLFDSLHKKPDLLQKILSRRKAQDKEVLASVLGQMSLALQKFTSVQKSCFIFGEEDWKYRALYATLKLPFVKRVSGSGHVVHLENPVECAHIIKEVIDAYT